MPTPQAPVPVIPSSANEGYYRRPGSSSSGGTSARRTPSRSQSRGQLRPPTASPSGSMLSNAGFNITVEPPVSALVQLRMQFMLTLVSQSRPESGRSGFMTAEQGMLSANDAEIPPQPPAPAQPQPPPAPESQPSPQPIPIPHGQLPPGFIPINPPAPSPQSVAQHAGETPAVYELYTPAAGAGDVPQSTEPVVVPLPKLQRYTRSALHGDSSSESSSTSEPVSSDTSSSMDSLTTPPQRQKLVSRPSYEAAETPPNVTYPLPPSRPSTSRTSSAARVPLPPSTVDSPQTSTITGARVPLPASTIGSPRSVYTRRGAATPSTVGQSSQTPPIVVPPRSSDP